jgi:hypothetical protein
MALISSEKCAILTSRYTVDSALDVTHSAPADAIASAHHLWRRVHFDYRVALTQQIQGGQRALIS